MPLATVALWDRNPKRHDVQGIWEAVERYGFKDPPKFEPELNGGEGGVVEGNGRCVVLRMMQAEYEKGGKEPPRGIAGSDGDWAVPVLFGVDAASQEAAEAYAIDHNNLTMAGGDFDGFEMARLWDSSYIDLLADVRELPVTVSGELMDILMSNKDFPLSSFDDFPQEESWASVISGEHAMPADIIRPNQFNPHAMSEVEFDRLVASIKDLGLFQRILVRPVGGGVFEVVDGAQRLRALGELGQESIPVSVRSLDDMEARVACICANKLTGKFIPERLGTVIGQVRDQLGDEESTKLLMRAGFAKEVIRSYDFAAGGTESGYGTKDMDGGFIERTLREYRSDEYQDIEGGMRTILIAMDAEDFVAVEPVLNGINVDWAAALLRLVDHWTTTTTDKNQ